MINSIKAYSSFSLENHHTTPRTLIRPSQVVLGGRNSYISIPVDMKPQTQAKNQISPQIVLKPSHEKSPVKSFSVSKDNCPEITFTSLNQDKYESSFGIDMVDRSENLVTQMDNDKLTLIKVKSGSFDTQKYNVGKTQTDFPTPLYRDEVDQNFNEDNPYHALQRQKSSSASQAVQEICKFSTESNASLQISDKSKLEPQLDTRQDIGAEIRRVESRIKNEILKVENRHVTETVKAELSCANQTKEEENNTVTYIDKPNITGSCILSYLPLHEKEIENRNVPIFEQMLSKNVSQSSAIRRKSTVEPINAGIFREKSSFGKNPSEVLTSNTTLYNSGLATIKREKTVFESPSPIVRETTQYEASRITPRSSYRPGIIRGDAVVLLATLSLIGSPVIYIHAFVNGQSKKYIWQL